MMQTRIPLTRDRVLQAALGLADEGGVEAVSMRKIADELGVKAMSLYNHVANKDDVIDGILDLVLAESTPPSPWTKAVCASATWRGPAWCRSCRTASTT